MRHFPLFVDLRRRPVLVVGGGVVAERKVALLLAAEPRITVVAPELCEGLAARVAAGEIRYLRRSYEPGLLSGQRLVIAATDDRTTNWRVASDADAIGILVNVVDDLEPSTCIVPAIVDRSPLVIAISTAGTAPVLARAVRARIELAIDESYGRLASLLERARNRIKAAFPDVRARRAFYERILQGALPDLVRAHRESDAEAAIESAVAAEQPRAGRVILVGAGPGDAGLLTMNAVRALQAADVVLYDRLVSPEILDYARREAVRIEVGKSGGRASTPQDAINALLADHAESGATVVRLKGGDPFVFGRGGEELEYLRIRGIAFEVVPGVTAASACAAYAGIPLTHRDHAASVRLMTAHRRGPVAVDPAACAARDDETLVYYMGVGMLAELQSDLLRAGHNPQTPLAFIENGTRSNQRVILGTLGEAGALAQAHRLCAPSLIVVGRVAALATYLHWFGSAPVGKADARESGVRTQLPARRRVA